MSCSTLPQELIDHILDMLAATFVDVASRYGPVPRSRVLAHCSLVARAWLPRSSYHLFGTLWLTNSHVPSFIEVARASPRLARYITALVLRHGPYADADVLEDLLEALPQLRTLEHWGAAGWHELVQGEGPWLESLPEHLLARIVRLTVALHSDVVTGHVAWEFRPQRDVIGCPRKQFDGSLDEDGLPALVLCDACSDTDVAIANAVLYHTGFLWRSLEIRSFETGSLNSDSSLAFSHCSQLESLTLHVDTPLELSWASRYLAKDVPEHVRRVAVDFAKLTAVDNLDTYWKQFAHGLDGCTGLGYLELRGLCRNLTSREAAAEFEERKAEFLCILPKHMADVTTCTP